MKNIVKKEKCNMSIFKKNNGINKFELRKKLK